MADISIIDQFLELPVPLQITIGVLILVALQQIRQKHIGRVGIVSAGAFVIATAYPIWSQLEGIWRLYVIVAVPFTFLAGISYITKFSLPTGFYRLALLLYGAIPMILVVVFGFPL